MKCEQILLAHDITVVLRKHNIIKRPAVFIKPKNECKQIFLAQDICLAPTHFVGAKPFFGAKRFVGGIYFLL